VSIHRKTNLPVLVDRVKTLESSKRRNLVYLFTAMLVLFGVATFINVVGL
jgi:hypothetical protein